MKLGNTVILRYSGRSGSDAETLLHGGRAREWGRATEGLQELEPPCSGPNPPAAAQEIYDLGHSTPPLRVSIADLPRGTRCDESAPGAEQAGDRSTGASE